MNIVHVAIGGALGSVLRYLISILVTRGVGHPSWVGTLLVNVVGSFLIAIFVALESRQLANHGYFRHLMVVGFCGGFTTFSTFTHEAYQLYMSGDTRLALLYTISSLLLSLGGLMLGLLVASKI